LDLTISADQNKYKLLIIFTIESVNPKRMVFLRVVKWK